MPRPVISRRAFVSAVSLVAAHFLAWQWVVLQNIQYDSGNILWWVVAFFILPAVALTCVLVSLARGLLGLRDSGETT